MLLRRGGLVDGDHRRRRLRRRGARRRSRRRRAAPGACGADSARQTGVARPIMTQCAKRRHHGYSTAMRSSLMKGNSSGRYFDRFSRAFFTYSLVTPNCEARSSVRLPLLLGLVFDGRHEVRMASLYWVSSVPQSPGSACSAASQAP